MTVSVFDILVIGTGGVILLSAVTMIVLSILNKKRFLQVCRLYEREFGSVQLAATVLRDADLLGFTAGYSTKMDFIIHPLIFGKKSIQSKMMM